MTRIAAICTSFHRQDVERMLEAAEKRAEELDLDLRDVFWVPGCYEMPYALKRIAEDDGIEGIVALGIIEKGETQHGEVMGHIVSEVLLRFQLKNDMPIGIGIIGPGAELEHLEPRLVPHANSAVEALDHMLKGPQHWRQADE